MFLWHIANSSLLCFLISCIILGHSSSFNISIKSYDFDFPELPQGNLSDVPATQHYEAKPVDERQTTENGPSSDSVDETSTSTSTSTSTYTSSTTRLTTTSSSTTGRTTIISEDTTSTTGLTTSSTGRITGHTASSAGRTASSSWHIASRAGHTSSSAGHTASSTGHTASSSGNSTSSTVHNTINTEHTRSNIEHSPSVYEIEINKDGESSGIDFEGNILNALQSQFDEYYKINNPGTQNISLTSFTNTTKNNALRTLPSSETFSEFITSIFAPYHYWLPDITFSVPSNDTARSSKFPSSNDIFTSSNNKKTEKPEEYSGKEVKSSKTRYYYNEVHFTTSDIGANYEDQNWTNTLTNGTREDTSVRNLIDSQYMSFSQEFGGVLDTIAIGSNMVFVVFAITFNFSVSRFYRREIKKLIPFLYFSVSITDLITSLSCLSHPLIFALLLLTDQGTLCSVLIISFYCISSTSIRAGVFYNLVLSVVRSLNIVNPFYQVKLGWIKIVCALYPVIWFIIAAYDIYWVVDLGYLNFPVALFKYMIYMPMVSNGLASQLLGEDASYVEHIFFGMTIPFLIPAVIVIICFVFQIYHLSATRPLLKNNKKVISKRPAITIFQLTLLFLVCNLSSTAVYIYFFLPSGSEQRRTGANDARVMYVATCVLHVVNATFSPLIMILRGRSLKNTIKSQLVSIRSKMRTKSGSVESWPPDPVVTITDKD